YARRKVKKSIILHKISIKVTLFSRTNYAFFGVDEPSKKGVPRHSTLCPHLPLASAKPSYRACNASQRHDMATPRAEHASRSHALYGLVLGCAVWVSVWVMATRVLIMLLIPPTSAYAPIPALWHKPFFCAILCSKLM